MSASGEKRRLKYFNPCQVIRSWHHQEYRRASPERNNFETHSLICRERELESITKSRTGLTKSQPSKITMWLFNSSTTTKVWLYPAFIVQSPTLAMSFKIPCDIRMASFTCSWKIASKIPR